MSLSRQWSNKMQRHSDQFGEVRYTSLEVTRTGRRSGEEVEVAAYKSSFPAYNQPWLQNLDDPLGTLPDHFHLTSIILGLATSKTQAQ